MTAVLTAVVLTAVVLTTAVLTTVVLTAAMPRPTTTPRGVRSNVRSPRGSV